MAPPVKILPYIGKTLFMNKKTTSSTLISSRNKPPPGFPISEPSNLSRTRQQLPPPLVNSMDRSVPVLDFNNLRSSVYNEFLNHDTLQGIAWKRFPSLTKILKGHRKGELTIMSGPTGSGKTTFLSESSLDLCLSGVRTLWGSFEIKNVRLCKLMLTQFAGQRIEEDLTAFEAAAENFSQLPMFFMDFHGEQSLSSVLDTMSQAVVRHKVDHVLIDNLQFMIGNECNRRFATMNRFEYQDLIIGNMRKFATEHDVHVTLVIHPKKTKIDEDLTNNCIFGGAKAIQEADNILLLQVRYSSGSTFKYKKLLQVSKNRFDGDLGLIPLEFNKEALTYGVDIEAKSREVVGGRHTRKDKSFQSFNITQLD